MDNIVKYKARLIAKGYSQVVRIDFNEKFSFMAKFTTIRTIVVIEVAMDIEMHQMNLKIAFLNRKLEEDIYIDQLQRFVEDGKQILLYKLKKFLYGIKQSRRAWYQCIDTFFVNEGFIKNEANYLLYVMQSNEFILIVILYIDDLIISTNAMIIMD